jgi:hypothetical protein
LWYHFIAARSAGSDCCDGLVRFHQKRIDAEAINKIRAARQPREP